MKNRITDVCMLNGPFQFAPVLLPGRYFASLLGLDPSELAFGPFPDYPTNNTRASPRLSISMGV